MRLKGIILEDIDVAVLEEKLLSTVKQYVVKGWPNKSKITPDILPYFQVHEELELVNDHLFRNNCLVVLRVLHKQVLMLAHTGHPGIVRMKQGLRQSTGGQIRISKWSRRFDSVKVAICLQNLLHHLGFLNAHFQSHQSIGGSSIYKSRSHYRKT